MTVINNELPIRKVITATSSVIVPDEYYYLESFYTGKPLKYNELVKLSDWMNRGAWQVEKQLNELKEYKRNNGESV